MTINTHIKRNAKKALQGQWSKGIAAGMIIWVGIVLLGLIEYTVFEILSSEEYKTIFSRYSLVQRWIEHGNYDTVMHLITIGIVFLLAVFFVTPLIFGYAKWSYSIASGKDSPMSLLFYYFTGIKKYFKTIGIIFSLSIRIAGYTLFSFLPSAFVYSISIFYSRLNTYSQYIYMVIIGFIWLALLMGISFGIYSVLKYVLVLYLHVEDPSLNGFQLIRLSSSLMKGQRRSAFFLAASFLPWLISCILIIPIIFVVPYFSVVYAIYAKYMIERGKKHDKIN